MDPNATLDDYWAKVVEMAPHINRMFAVAGEGGWWPDDCPEGIYATAAFLSRVSGDPGFLASVQRWRLGEG